MQRSVLALDNPSYQNGILTIPRVDTPEQVGKYLDITMTPTNEGTWKLDSYKESGTEASRLADIRQVELLSTDTQPKQVFLQVSITQDCFNNFGQIDSRLDNKNEFNITVHDPINHATQQGCFYIKWYYKRTIALPVFGLKAGTYTYNINNKWKGSFTLDVDNGKASEIIGVTS
jgi:hypothetical protein